MKIIRCKPKRPNSRMLYGTSRIQQNAKTSFLNTREKFNKTDESENSPEQYASDQIIQSTADTVQNTFTQGRRLSQNTKRTMLQRHDTIRIPKHQVPNTQRSVSAKGHITKAASRTNKTASQSAKVAAKTAKVAVKTSRKTAAAVRTTRTTMQSIKLTTKAVIAAVKATITAIKGLVTAVTAGGWVAVLIIVIIGSVAMLLCSPYGIFFQNSNAATSGRMTLIQAITNIDSELSERISAITLSAEPMDSVDIYVDNAIDGDLRVKNWPDVLAVFTVRTSMDSVNPMGVAEFDETRFELLRQVFWDMNTISYQIIHESAPPLSPAPSISPDETPEAITRLTFHVSSKSYSDMVDKYQMGAEQKAVLYDLMSAKNFIILKSLTDDAVGSPANDWSDIIDAPDGGMDIPLYLQGDYPQTVCYWNGSPVSVRSSGCGAACVSMVVAYLTGDTAQTPYTLFSWAYENGYYHGQGLGHTALVKLAELYGIQGTWIENDADQITTALLAGYPIIAHMGPGIFTKGGHYIVLRGITEEGYVMVNDPGNRNRNRFSYPLETILEELKTSCSIMICNCLVPHLCRDSGHNIYYGEIS